MRKFFLLLVVISFLLVSCEKNYDVLQTGDIVYDLNGIKEDAKAFAFANNNYDFSAKETYKRAISYLADNYTIKRYIEEYKGKSEILTGDENVDDLVNDVISKNSKNFKKYRISKPKLEEYLYYKNILYPAFESHILKHKKIPEKEIVAKYREYEEIYGNQTPPFETMKYQIADSLQKGIIDNVLESYAQKYNVIKLV